MEKMEWNPDTLMQTTSSYWKAATLQAGVFLDIFTHLADGGMYVDKITQAIGSDLRATELLLNALVSIHLLTLDGERYKNTPFAGKFLNKNSEDYMGHIINHHHYLSHSWANLPEAVLTGKPQRDRVPYEMDKKRIESFIMGMYNIAKANAPIVAHELDLTGAKTLLDLGGGPGTYAINFCIKNKDLTATVFDLETTKEFAEKTIASYGLSERIDFFSGDFHETAIPETYDVIWISHILHAENEAKCQELINKATEHLNTGGKLFIQEFVLNDDKTSPPHPALFALNMLLGTEGGRSYSRSEIKGMLKNAGLKHIEDLKFKMTEVLFGKKD